MIEIFKQAGESDNQAIADEIIAHPDRYIPPVLFFLAEVLFRNGRYEEAIFWYHAGHIRGAFDTKRCLDKTVHSYLPMLLTYYGAELKKYMGSHLSTLERIVPQVIEWDRNTPHNYDHRWINLRGSDATNLPVNDMDNNELTSAPSDEWQTIEEYVRTEYLKSFRACMEKMKKNRNR
jgi:hypothetical protein